MRLVPAGAKAPPSLVDGDMGFLQTIPNGCNLTHVRLHMSTLAIGCGKLGIGRCIVMRAARTRQTGAVRSRNARGEGEKLRGEIIAAAVKVLSALGPEDQFSLRSIAKMARIAAPSVYIHFSDRNVLLLAVLETLFAEQVAIRAAAEMDAAKAGGGAWERLLARSVASVRFGLEHPGHYKVLFEGRVVPRLDDPRIASFGRPLLVRSIELIRDIPSQ